MSGLVRGFVLAVLMVGLLAGAAQAQNTVFYLPQVANGTFAGGSFRTTFMAFNPNTVAVTIDIELTDQIGAPLVVTIPTLGTASKFNLVLAAGASRIVQTSGAGSLAVGAATVTANTSLPMGISAVFTLFDGAGKFVSEAGVGRSTPLSRFVLPVDTSGAFNTGLALFNFNTTDANLQLLLFDQDGTEVGRVEFVLPARHQRASLVAGELFSGVSNLKGTLRVTSSVQIAAVALRQHENPASFTTLPVVSQASTQRHFVLPQVSNGEFAGGAFRTTFIVFNLSPLKAQVTIRLSRDDGTPLELNLGSLGRSSVFDIELDPGRAFFGQTDGAGELSAGAATVTSSRPVGVSSIFTVLDASNRFVTEAGVGDSPQLHSFSIPVEVARSVNTGVAFFNNSPAAAAAEISPQEAQPVTLTLQLRNQQGATVGHPVSLQLEPGQHSAKFVTELVPALLAFRGTLTVRSSGDVSALTIRQGEAPLVVTTLPVAAGAFDPAQPAGTIPLRHRVADFEGTKDREVNLQLPGGFRLSGEVTGAWEAEDGVRLASEGPLNGRLQLIDVRAVSQTGTRISGSTLSDGRGYVVRLPAGVYRLTFCYIVEEEDFSELSPILTFEAPGTIQVQSDMRRDFTVPPVQLFTVSGTVSGLAKLPDPSLVDLFLTSVDSHAHQFFVLGPEGAYLGGLPDGTYRAGLSSTVFDMFGPSRVVQIFDLGTVTVAGADTTADFEVPDLVTISGKVTLPDLALSSDSVFVYGRDLRAPFSEPCGRAPVVNQVRVDPSTGDYQMQVEKGKTYEMEVEIFSFTGGISGFFLLFPFPSPQVTPEADTRQDFHVGELPEERLISGRITGPDGAPLADVFVFAVAGPLTGLPGVFYVGFGSSDQDGNYELSIRDAEAVGLTFVP